MAWFDSMPDDDITAIAYLRKQLDTATDPLHRHFAFNELERRLYKCRHAFASALTEFDHTCESHDSEMTTIRPALVDAVGAVPFLPTYRQASIRHLNARDLRAAARWTVLGIAAYADQPVDPADLQDLDDRLARLQVDGRALADGEWR